MELSFTQIIDIKCILSGRSKKQIASDLCISQMTLSREIKDQNILRDLNDYFDEIDVEINRFCDKLRESNNLVSESKEDYRPLNKNERDIAEKEYVIKIQNDLIESLKRHNSHLEDDVINLNRDIQDIAKIYPDIIEPEFKLKVKRNAV